MLLEDTKYEKCESCGAHKRVIQEAIYGCDNCKKVIDLNKKYDDCLEIMIFHHNEETDRLQLCSWKCVFKILPKLKTDYFISLPYLSYDKQNPRTRPSAFFKELKK